MKPSWGPLVSAGVVLGAGMGGFVDGIVLHQILQWHNMLSSVRAPNDLVSTKVNMVYDGYFHAGVWVMTVIGIVLLFRAGGRREVPWSGRALFGASLLGWGWFNLIEGAIDHHLLGLHHVREFVPASTKAAYDWGFLLVRGVLFILLGRWIVSSAKREWRESATPVEGVEAANRRAYLK